MASVGFKYLGRKALAFRSDHCRSCDAAVVARRVRSWIWLTVFWVPVLPLGFRHRWLGKSCGHVTSAVPRLRRAWKIALAVLLSVAFVGTFRDRPEQRSMRQDVQLDDYDGIPLWAIRCVFGFGALAAGVWSLRHRPIPPRSEGLSDFEPVAFEDCPLCGGELKGAGEALSCAGCDAEQSFL